ncbi:non-ribosomal peptide synthetase [Nocardia paucivorans]|uniref:non-ribosomal peptide synthetase n=1 Tax=Nocardia paucivorans TaxID=114259 RepID=UPI00030B76D6|nr:non-ribosomal peptide synthetase [Nocardia paucivorans]
MSARTVLAELLDPHVRKSPDRCALRCGERSATFAELDDAADRIATALVTAGVTPGARVAYLGRESVDFYALLFGCAKAEAVFVPINNRLAADEIAHILADSAATLLLLDADFSFEPPDDLPVISVSNADLREWYGRCPAVRPHRDITADDAVVQLYTSGTTGRPKGVVLAHRSFFAVRDALAGAGLDWLDWRPDDVTLVGLPGFHIGGMWCALQGMMAGATTVTMPHPDPATAVRLVAESAATVLCVVPTTLQWMLDEPAADAAAFASVRKIVYGGAPMPADVLGRAEAVIGCEFAQIYGLTETGNTAVCLPPEDHRRGGARLRSVGRPYPGFAVQVIGADGRPLPAGEVGEICLRTPARMLGYFKNPAATEVTVVDGWIHTGDAGHLDADGYLYLGDRIKDMINVGGEHVYPAEVERVLREHPAVTDVAVVGVPDPQFGELAHAVVVVAPDTAVTANELLAFAGKRLAAHKVPARFEFTDALPRNASGKVLRHRIREHVGGQAMDQPGGGSSSGTAQPSIVDLTVTQTAYWVGRRNDIALGGVAPWCYFEVERTARQLRTGDPLTEIAALQAAWNRLIADHDVLRMEITPEGRAHIPPSRPEYRIGLIDLRGRTDREVDSALAESTAAKSHQVRDPSRWPLFDITAAVLPHGGLRLFLGFDMIAMDVPSWALLMRYWRDLVYSAPVTPPPPTGVEGRRSPSRSQRDRDIARAYWLARIPTLPPGPALPWAEPPDRVHTGRFHRHEAIVPAERWSRLCTACHTRGLHPRAVLLAAYGLVLNRWGARDPFCINTVVFDRDEDVPATAVGDFTTTSLTQLPHPTTWRTFADLARAAHEQLDNDLAHGAFDGLEVQHAMGMTTAPRYPVVFTDCTGLPLTDPMTWLGDVVHGVSQTPQVVLDFMLWDHAEGGARLVWDAVDRVLPDRFVSGLLAAYERLLAALADDTGSWQRVDLGANPHFEPVATFTPHSRPECGPLLIDPQRQRADIDPDAPAIIGATGTLTHGELTVRSAAMAAAMMRDGVAPGDRVAVVASGSVARVVACYAVSAAGATLVPLDPRWPTTRIATACARAEVRYALAETEHADTLPPSIRVGDLNPIFESTATVDIPCTAAPDDLAYIIFTSGSTGEPKGVAIEHAAARTTIDDINDRFGVGPADRVLALSAPTFDLSIYDVYGVLGAGGAMVVPDPTAALDPAEWSHLIAEHGVTVWNTAPAVAQMLVEYAEDDPVVLGRLMSLRLMLLSGDWIPLSLPQRLHTMLPELRVVSLGGATEASIWSICHPIERMDPGWRSIPYGRALRDQFFLVLDEDGRPCPVGVPGELHIGGAGLARGYVGDERQTAHRFYRHPVFDVRLYRTGDLGRWSPDGTIEFLGRVDRQLKILGHRIEPGEVEAVLTTLPQIRQCLVTGHRGKDGQMRLVAYLVGRSAPPDPEAVTAHARSRLPAYMVPTRWVVLNELPLTSNGKIDHAALPDPFTGESVTVSDTAPGSSDIVEGDAPIVDTRASSRSAPRTLTEDEQWTAALWSELLGVTITDPDADFFALGGHSVLATRMLFRVRADGYAEIGLREVISHSTVAEFTGLLVEKRRGADPDRASRTVPAPTRSVPDEPFALTRVQHAYLLGRSSGTACYVFNEFHCTQLDLDRYEQAWNIVIARHPMLRTVITTDYLNRVIDPVPRYRIRRYDLTALPDEEREARLLLLREQLSHRVIRHDRWPLFDVRAAILGAGELRLFVGVDALICDASSFFLLDRHLRQAYAEPSAHIPTPQTTFADYVTYTRNRRNSDAHTRAVEYWNRRIPTIPGPPTLPTRHKTDSVPRFTRRADHLSAEQWEKLGAVAARHKLTPSAVLLTVYADALVELSGDEHFSIMLTLMDRPLDLPDIDQVVGEFTALVVHEVDHRESECFLDRARRTQQRLFDDLDHSHHSAVDVLTDLTARTSRRVRLPAVFTSGLDIGDLVGGEPHLNWVGRLEYGISQTPDVWLDHQVLVEDGRLHVRWDVLETVLDGTATDTAFTAMMRSLRRLADDPTAWAGGGAGPASVDDITHRLTALWADVLGIDIAAVDPMSGFVASGGDSVSAVRLVRQVRGVFGLHLPIDEIIAPEFTLAALISRTTRATAETGARTGPVTDLFETTTASGPFELTPLQQAYWVGQHDAWSLSCRTAHGYADLLITGIDGDELHSAVRRLVDRHPMLRTVFSDNGTQEVLDETDPRPAELPVEEIDLTTASPATVDAEITRIRSDMQRLGPEYDPWPFRIVAVRLPEGRLGLHMVCSLLVADGWSGQLLVGDLLTYLDEPNAVLPPQTARFADYVTTLAARRRTPQWERDRQWWWDRIDNLPPAPALPVAGPVEHIRPEIMQRREARLTSTRFAALTEQCRQHGIIPSAVFATCYAIALARAARHRHFLLNVLYLDRITLPADLDQVVGPFATTTLVELRLPRSAAFVELARHTQSATARTFDHTQISGVEVVREIARRRRDTRPVAPVVFHSMLGLRPPAPIPEGVRILDSSRSIRTPQVSLDLQVGPSPWQDDEITIGLDAITELFEPAVVDTIFDDLVSTLERLATDPGFWNAGITLPVSELPASVDEYRPTPTTGPLTTPTEHLVADVWSKVLGDATGSVAAGYDRSTDFFHAGGTSVTAIAMLRRIRDLTGTSIRARQFLSAPTIGDLAAVIDTAPAHDQE